jgi:hypothetical protein
MFIFAIHIIKLFLDGKISICGYWWWNIWCDLRGKCKIIEDIRLYDFFE